MPTHNDEVKEHQFVKPTLAVIIKSRRRGQGLMSFGFSVPIIEIAIRSIKTKISNKNRQKSKKSAVQDS